MAQTETELFNLTAQVIGGRGNLASTSQKSRYTDVFNLWYPSIRALVLKAAWWPCASKTATLGLVQERTQGQDWTNTDPTPGAKYAYLVPPDLLHPRHLSSYGHFEVGMIDDSKCLMAHESQAILSYTFDQTNIGKWEPELFLTVAHALGAFTAITLTGKPKRAELLQIKANQLLEEQRASANNFNFAPRKSVSAWHAARGYFGAPDQARFVYPNGALLAVGESASVK